MNEEINKKIQVLIAKAKVEKEIGVSEKRKVDSTIPNSLAESIKTEEQAKSFMTLLRSL